MAEKAITLRMAKPCKRDIDAAMELLSVLNEIDGRFGGPWPTEGPRTLQELEESFDCDKKDHLQALYNNLARLLQRAPGFAGRVIFGMCSVICYEENNFLDPAQDVLAMHPDVLEGLELLEAKRADFLPRLEREALANLSKHIDQCAATHLAEMRAQRKAKQGDQA